VTGAALRSLAIAALSLCAIPVHAESLPSFLRVLTPDEWRIAASVSKNLPMVLESGRDLWGEAAMRLPDGPSYEFFAGLIPPMRYVNAEFRHYPIVLSAPGSERKARLVSNGSAINARANLKTWREVGFPVTFSMGEDREPFGSDLRRLDGPHYERGYLPIVQLAYSHARATYVEEAFAAVEPELARAGVVFVRFSLSSGKAGVVTAHVGFEGEIRASAGRLTDDKGNLLVAFSRAWRWDPATRELRVGLTRGASAVLGIVSAPAPLASLRLDYDAQRRTCTRMWQSILARAMRLEVPEEIVNRAWRSALAGSLSLVKGDLMCYSAGNQYERIYVQEGLDAIRSLMLWGYAEEARRLMVPILDFKREGLLFHQAGLKLQMLSNYYWLTRDSQYLKQNRDRWMLQAERIVSGREADSGLFPREQYCGDIATPVYSLNSNSNAWRGLRDFSAVLAEIGEVEQSKRCAESAAAFKPAILKAVEKSGVKLADGLFIPIALSGEEKPYDIAPATRLGGYYDLMAPLVLGSGVLGCESERTTGMLDYLHRHGGICMGMVRCHPQNEMYRVKQGIDNLYSLRYVLTLLRRDDVDRALVSFYGKLAQGFTRDTFIDGETAGIVPDDEFGRPTYMPPNSAGNGFFLTMLRYLLVQDWDMDDDGVPDTLRLAFATPRRWLADGKSIRIERAPTAFGEVSLAMRSDLKKGEIVANVIAPPRTPYRLLLRARQPAGWRVTGASVSKKSLPVDESGAVDLTGMGQKIAVRFSIARGIAR